MRADLLPMILLQLLRILPMIKVKPDKGFIFLWHNSWRMLWRDWRGGELNILAIGLVIAVTSITAVGFFTDRIERGLKLQ